MASFPQYSVIVPESDTADAGHIRRNAFDATAQVTVRGGCRSAYEIFRHGCAVSPGGPCLGWRPLDAATKEAGPYVFMTYREVLSRVDCLHHALATRDALAPTAESEGMRLLAIYSKNRPE